MADPVPASDPAAAPASLPTVSELLGSSEQLPTAGELLDKAVPHEEQNAIAERRYRQINTGTDRASPVQDFLFRSDGPGGKATVWRNVGRVLDAFGQGYLHGYGEEPVGLSQESIDALRKHGIFNDWSAGQRQLGRALNEAVMRPLAWGLDDAWRALFQAPFAGAQAAVKALGEQEGFEGFKPGGANYGVRQDWLGGQTGRQKFFGDVAAIPEALGGSPHPTGIPKIHPADINAARELNIIGPGGEAAFLGTKEAVGPKVPPVDEPPPPPAPPDLHAIVRASEPKLFEEYDALTHRRDILRRFIEDPDATKAGADLTKVTANLKEAEARLRELAPSVEAAYRKAEGEAGTASPATTPATPAEPAVEVPPAGVPPMPEGHVRFYHGGDNPDSGGGRWVSQNLTYARDYRPGQSLHYVDIPETWLQERGINKSFDDTGTGQKAPYVNFEAPEELARQMKPYPPAEAEEPPRKIGTEPSATAAEPPTAAAEAISPPTEPVIGPDHPIVAEEYRRNLAAGIPPEEAMASAIVQAHMWETHAARFEGRKGTALEAYRRYGPSVKGGPGMRPVTPELVARAEDALRKADAAKAAETATESTAARPAEVPSVTPEDATIPPAYRAAPLPGAIPNTVREFSPGELLVDARRFQFKEGGNENGVTERLKGVTRWDSTKANMAMVWVDKDGRAYIVDGHQRHALATRIAAEDPAQNPRLTAYVLREADGVSDVLARVMAAGKNISEGTGTAVDAAKVLRDRPHLIDTLPPRSELVRQARDLVNLSDDAFMMVVNDVVPANYAAIVGRLAPQDAKLQSALLDLLAKTDPSNADQAEAIVRQGINAGLAKEERGAQGSLFGDEDVATSLYVERAKVLDRALKDLKRDKTVFSVLSKEQETIEAAGNTLAADINEKRAASDAQALQVLQILASRTGPVSDALNAAAQRARTDGRVAGAVSDFIGTVRRLVESGDLARLADGVERGPAHVGAEDAASVIEPAPEQPAAGAGVAAAGEVRDVVNEVKAAGEGGTAAPAAESTHPARDIPGVHFTASEASGQEDLFQIKAFHGSPHDFDRFDLSKIGTGEGAQAYGHGLYFADEEQVAKNYRDDLSKSATKFRALTDDENAALPRDLTAMPISGMDEDALRGRIKWLRDSIEKRAVRLRADVQSDPSLGGMLAEREAQIAAMDKLLASKSLDAYKPEGKLYQVSIAADPEHFLDWDKPLSEQSPQVQEALKSIQHPVTQAWQTNGAWPHVRAQNFYDVIGGDRTNAAVASGKTKSASEQLRSAGIPGIKYLDQGSRNVNGIVNLETKYRAANLDNSSSTVERFFATRFKEHDGDLDKTVAALKRDLARNPDDATVQKTLEFAQDPGNKFTYEPPKKQTSNYVVFDDSLIEITHKDGTPVKAQERKEIVDALTHKGKGGQEPEDLFQRRRSTRGPAPGQFDLFSALEDATHRVETNPGDIRAREELRHLVDATKAGALEKRMFTRDQLERMDTADLDRMAFGHTEGDKLRLNPGDINIKFPDDLENPEDKFAKGGMKWARSVDFSEPVHVSIGEGGKFYLEDGHHRWFAAQKLGRPLNAEITKVTGKPIEEILRRQEQGLPPPFPQAHSATAGIGPATVEATRAGPQNVLPGFERSAVQAAASREASGGMRSAREQQEPGGLFAERGEGQEELFQADRRPSRKFGIPKAAEPVISSHRDVEAMKANPHYEAAKAGDGEAARQLVEQVVKPETIEAARERFGPDALYVPVHAQEAAGRNAIPMVLANYYAAMTDARVDPRIIQTSKSYHTGMRPMERIIARPTFDGPVEPGRRYVLVDDVTQMGNTLAELAHHIQEGGGEVAGIVTLANAGRVEHIVPKPARAKRLEANLGQSAGQELGIEHGAFTAAETEYLLGIRNADALRTSIAKATRERAERLRAKGILPPEDEAGVEDELFQRTGSLADAINRRREERTTLRGEDYQRGAFFEHAFNDRTFDSVRIAARELPALGRKIDDIASGKLPQDKAEQWANLITQHVRMMGRWLNELDAAGRAEPEAQAVAGAVESASKLHEAIEKGDKDGILNAFEALKGDIGTLEDVRPKTHEDDILGGEGDELYQRDLAPPFYSAVERAVTASKQSKASPEQWLGMLKNVPGVKPEEMEWLGLSDWLKEQRGPVTREQIADYVRANRIEVREVTKGGAVSPEEMNRVADLIDQHIGTFADWAEGNEDYTHPEVTVNKPKFDYETTIDGKPVTLHVEADDYEAESESPESGWINARVTFPDGRTADTGLWANVKRGRLRAEPYGSGEWGERRGSNRPDEFTDEEREAIDDALRDIDADVNHVINKDLQNDADSFDDLLKSAQKALRNGDVERAVSELKDAGSLERQYGDDPIATEILDELNAEENETKYAQYQLPGGENYRELLLTLPPSEKLPSYREWLDARGLEDNPDEAAVYQAMMEHGTVASTENYRSSHFDEPNILAHVRFNDRVIDGKRTLFVEEVQSDWHQAGKKRGYQGEELAAAQKERDRANEANDRQFDKLLDAMSRDPALAEHLPIGRRNLEILAEGALSDLQEDPQSGRWGDEVRQQARLTEETRAAVARAHEAVNAAGGAGGVPDAPFKTTWPELSMKRMIRYAAEHGYDQVAWTTGETQAARYDLSKHIDHLRVLEGSYEETGGAGYEVVARRNGNEVFQRRVKREDLPDVIGKEMADKVLEKIEENKKRPVPKYVAEFSGLDLKVGGEGMKGFYDDILPKTVNKLTKKFGGKVGKGEIDAEKPFRALPEDGSPRDYATRQEAEEFLGSLPESRAGDTVTKLPGTPVHTLPITDALREAATEQGFPLFQGNDIKRGKTRFDLNNLDQPPEITYFKDSNASTLLHEPAHAWLVRFARDAQDPEAPEQVKADLRTSLDFMGLQTPEQLFERGRNGKLTDRARKAHERWARGFEAYIMEGWAPSEALARVFEQFRVWLAKIYGSLKGLEAEAGFTINLSPEMREVFDRRLTAEPRQRPVIAPESEPAKGFADIHEADAALAEDHNAHATAETIQAERDSKAAETLVDESDAQARLANVAPETRRRETGSPQPRRDGDEAGPVEGEGDAAAQPGTERPGGGEAAGEGAGARGEGAGEGAGLKPARGGETTPPPASPSEPFDDSPEAIDKAGNIRLDKLNAPDDVKDVIREVANQNNDFLAARRYVISDKEALDLADALGMDAAKLNRRRIGQAFNAEEIIAARKLLVQSATAVRDAMAKAADGTEADLLAFAEARERHLMIQQQVAGLTAEAGRALRAFRFMAGAKEATQLGDFLRDATGGMTLFQLKRMAKLGSAYTTPGQVSEFVANSAKPNFADMMLEYWINGLISGPATHTTYMIGNELLALNKAGPETAVAAAIGSLRNAFGDNGPRVYWGEVPAQLFGMISGIPKGLIAAWEAGKTGRTTALPGELASMSAAQLARSPLMTNRAAIPDFSLNAPGLGRVPVLPLGTLARLPSRGIAMIHSLFRAMNYEREMAALAYRDAASQGLSGQAFASHVASVMANPAADLMEQARSSATDLTLMGHGGNLTRNLSRLTNTRFWGGQWLKFVDPFVHISSNIIEQAILQRTPVGIVDPDIRANLSGANGPVARDTAIARMVVGSAIAVGAGSMAAQGMLNGSGPSDPHERAIWTMVNGPPHSMRIGDMWYDIHRLGPIGMQFGIAADIYHLSQVIGEEDGAKVAADIAHAFTQNIIDESPIRGPAEIMRAITDPDRYGASWMRQFVASWAPYSVGQGQIARAIDPYSRSARTTLDAIKAKVPWLSETLLPRYDVFGQEIPNKSALGVPGLSAIYEQQVNNDPVPRAMLDAGYFPAMPQRKIRNVELTEEQYADYARIAGRMAKMRLDAIVRTPGFDMLPPGVRHDTMVQAMTQSRQEAEMIILAQHPDIIKAAVDAKKAKFTGEKVHH